ncbi:hypothetical protein M8J77_008420 [Diaphorina citri]|nr:hypothetical protein M8J77_008420 [Diaphorina citri]
MLDAYSRHINSNIILISEPNVKIALDKKYIVDQNIDAAIVIQDDKLQVDKIIRKRGYVCVKTADLMVVSVYISPNVDDSIAEEVIGNISRDINGWQGKLVIGGDFNAKTREWGNKKNDRRGDLLLDWMGSENLYVANQGDTPTFVRDQQNSILDITLCSANTLRDISEWKVQENELTLSLHRYITFNLLGEDDNAQPRRHEQAKQGWKFNTERSDALQNKFKQLCERSPPKDAEQLQDTLKETCDAILTKRGGGKNYKHEPVYWWTQKINDLRKECIRKKRIMTRNNKKGYNQVLARTDYKAAKKELRLEIRKSKEECWRRIIEEVENDVWGTGYRIVARKIPGKILKLSPQLEREILTTLFPESPLVEWSVTEVEREEIPLINVEELGESLLALKCGKAPGPDQVTPEILKCTGLGSPTVFLEVFNEILRSGIFPAAWKTAKVVLIPKPNKPEFIPSSYRPLCLLDTCGKLFECLLVKRLKSALGENGLSPNQFGFRANMSTVQAIQKIYDIADNERKKSYKTRNLCLLITVDIRNAFGSAPWDKIITALEMKNTPSYIVRLIKSYFKDRELITPNGERMKMSAGIPQGSVAAPTLWNVFYDELLRLNMPPNVTLVGYADDLAVAVRARKESELESLTNQTLTKISTWLKNQGLTLAPEKTEATLLIGRKKCGHINIIVDGVPVLLRDQVKYLGLTLDRKLSFGAHVDAVTEKAANRANALIRIMPKKGGPSYMKRKLIYRVAESIIMYAAPVWSKATETQRYKDKLTKVQRKILLNVTSAYRTISTTALQVIAAITPIDLMIKERAKTFGLTEEQKADHRELTINNWELAWRTSSTGEWTRKLIPSIKPWVLRKHGNLNFYITQVLSGHGCFNFYLHRFKLRSSPICRYCDQSDTAEHSLFVCARWTRNREEASNQVGETLTADNLIKNMLKSQEDWTTISRLITEIMTTKERDERAEEKTRRIDDQEEEERA